MGPTGSRKSGLHCFFALKKDSLPALVIQYGFSPYTSNSPDTLVEPELPPVLFPRVPTYTLPLATVGTVKFDRVSRLISSRLQAIPQLTGLVMIGSAAFSRLLAVDGPQDT